MSAAKTVPRCSFCGRSEQMVRRLIAGPDGVSICDGCVQLCQQILQSEGATAKAAPLTLTEVPPPQRLYQALSDYVVG